LPYYSRKTGQLLPSFNLYRSVDLTVPAAANTLEMYPTVNTKKLKNSHDSSNRLTSFRSVMVWLTNKLYEWATYGI